MIVVRDEVYDLKQATVYHAVYEMKIRHVGHTKIYLTKSSWQLTVVWRKFTDQNRTKMTNTGPKINGQYVLQLEMIILEYGCYAVYWQSNWEYLEALWVPSLDPTYSPGARLNLDLGEGKS